MDCVSFRRRLLEDPLRQEPQLLAHEDACAACAQFARRTRADEARLHAALMVAPPPELAERIRLAASFEPAPRPSRRRSALAAGLAMLVTALGIGWFVSPLERTVYPLADSVLHHVHDEMHHMYEVGPVPPWQLDALFRAYGARVTGDLGRVSFAARCLMRRKMGIHLVLAGERGPVTVFFMPAEALASAIRLADARFVGIVKPTSWGSLAVIGEAGEALEPVAQRVMGAVAWPTPISRLETGLTPGGRYAG